MWYVGRPRLAKNDAHCWASSLVSETYRQWSREGCWGNCSLRTCSRASCRFPPPWGPSPSPGGTRRWGKSHPSREPAPRSWDARSPHGRRCILSRRIAPFPRAVLVSRGPVSPRAAGENARRYLRKGLPGLGERRKPACSVQGSRPAQSKLGLHSTFLPSAHRWSRS